MQVCFLLHHCMVKYMYITIYCITSLDCLLFIGQGRSDTLQSDVIVNSITIGMP